VRAAPGRAMLQAFFRPGPYRNGFENRGLKMPIRYDMTIENARGDVLKTVVFDPKDATISLYDLFDEHPAWIRIRRVRYMIADDVIAVCTAIGLFGFMLYPFVRVFLSVFACSE
jgi:hypothetical protein